MPSIFSTLDSFEKLDLGDGIKLHVKTNFTYSEHADIIEKLLAAPKESQLHDYIRLSGFIAEKCVVGWEGIKDDIGNEVVFSTDKVKQLNSATVKIVSDFVTEKITAKKTDKKKEA